MHAKSTFFVVILLWQLLSPTHSVEAAEVSSQTQYTVHVSDIKGKKGAEKIKLLFNEARLTSNVGDMIRYTALALDAQLPNVAESFMRQGMDVYAQKADSLQWALIYLCQGKIKNHFGAYRDAVDGLSKSLSICQSNSSDTLSGHVQLEIGKSYWLKRDYPQAIEYFDLANDFAVKHLNERLRLEALSSKGLVYSQIANYPKAIELQLLVNELALKNHYTDLVATSFDQAGLVYLSVGQYQKAHDVFKEALLIFKTQGDSVSIGKCLAHLGDTFLKMGNPAQSIDLALQSLKISEKLGDTLAICSTKAQLGQIEMKNGQPQQAVKQYLQALDLMRGREDVSLMAAIRFYLGEAFLVMGNPASAYDYLAQSAQTASKLGERNLMAKCYNALSSAHEQRGDYVNALRSKNEFALLKDSILNEQTIEYIARMDAIYRSIYKENIIRTLKAQNDDAAKSLASQHTTSMSFLIVIVMLVVLSVVLFAAFKIKQNSSKKLGQMNMELAHLNATKDKFFSIISHDLKSPINSLMGFAEMIVLHAEAGHYDKLGEFGQMAYGSSKKLYNLVDNLLLWSRTQVGTTPYQPQNIDVGIQCQNIIALLKLGGEEKDILINGKLEKNLMAYADVNLFNTVLRNLISNAIKFSPVGATVTVTTKKQHDHILVSVADTGVGIAPENLHKLFRIDSNYSTLGTFNEKGSGLGLVLCKEFVEINKGTIGVESEAGKGSVFYFTVPLAIKKY